MFFLDQQAQSQGPVTLEQLQAMLTDGRVSGSTLVWEDGMPQWTALAEHLQRVGGAQQQQRPADVQAAQLRAFQAEVQALETGGAGAVADDRPGTPEEKSFVDDDGTAYTWDASRRCFVPHQLSCAAPSYALEDMTMPDEPQDVVPAPPPLARPPVTHGGEDDGAELTPEQIAAELEAERLGKRRREPDDVAEEQAAGQEAKQGSRKKAAAQAKVNTSVYVTGLPADASEAELAAVFAKCGLVKENEDGTPKVKLYRDKATGQPKGDALVTYLKAPSVALALSILDGSQFRLGSGPPMAVTEAQFEEKAVGRQLKGSKNVKEKKESSASKVGGKAKGRGKGPPGSDAALGWDGFDDVAAPRRVVLVLRGMFAPEELREAGALEELRGDIAAECGKSGTVETVRVFEHHPEGVVSVKFRDPADADACRVKMHGRWFGGRQLSAAMYDGRTDLDAHRPKTNKLGETEEEQAARLERFARELEEADGE